MDCDGLIARTPKAVGSFLLLIGILASGAGATGSPCEAESALVRVDHVVVAVRDLELATKNFEDLGFQLKDGRPHANTIRNRHIELADGTELELLTASEPKDGLAASYLRFLADGDGGAYLALQTTELEAVVEVLEGEGLAVQHFDSGSFRYATVSDAGFEAIFVIDYQGGNPLGGVVETRQPNGAAGISKIWVEGGSLVRRALEGLGASSCGSTSLDPEHHRAVFGVGSVAVVVVEPPRSDRPRVFAVEFVPSQQVGEAVPLPPTPVHGLVLSFRR